MNMVKTLEWGWVEPATVKTVRCPKCRAVLNGRLSVSGKMIEVPNHGRTVELECRGGGWYSVRQ